MSNRKAMKKSLRVLNTQAHKRFTLNVESSSYELTCRSRDAHRRSWTSEPGRCRYIVHAHCVDNGGESGNI